MRSFEDGTSERIFLGMFYDRTMKTLCFIQRLGPDAYGCAADFGWAEEVFSDDGCTDPIIVIHGFGSFDSRYVRAGFCTPRIFQVGPLSSGRYYSKRPGGTCAAGGFSQSLMPVAQPVSLSTFGVFTRQKETTVFPRERSGTRLALETWRFIGTDGSFEARPPRIIDLVRKSEGSVQLATDGTLRFLPALRRHYDPYSGAFASATCEGPLIAFEVDPTKCQEDPFEAKAALISAGCAGVRAMAEPTAAPLTVLHRSYDETTCVEEPVPAAYRIYPAQALTEIPASTLAQVARKIVPSARQTSGDKLEARADVTTSADGLEVESRTPRLYLRKFDLSCSPDGFDGASRCMPDAIPWDDARTVSFADDQCTTPILSLLNAASCGTVPSWTIYRGRTPDGRDAIFRRPPGDPLQLTQRYVKDHTGCHAIASNDTYVHFPVGTSEEVPASEFPKLVHEEFKVGD